MIELVVKKQQSVTSKPDIKTTPLWSRFVQLVSKVFVLCQNNLSLAQRITHVISPKQHFVTYKGHCKNILKIFWCEHKRKYLYFFPISDINANQFYRFLERDPVVLNVQNCILCILFTCIAAVFSHQKNSHFVVIVFGS